MNEIHTVLELVRRVLEEFLQKADRRAEEWVTLSNIMGNDGRESELAKSKLVMVLANIVHDSMRNAVDTRRSGGVPVPPPLHVNLSVLLYANFHGKNYPEGLALISRAIAFFHENPVFTQANLPGLDAGIDRITIEHENLDLSALNELMDMLGAKYLPSVWYRLRIIPVSEQA